MSSSHSDSGEPPAKMKPPVNHAPTKSECIQKADPDFAITSEGETLMVHRNVITKHSHYFNALLEGVTNMKEAQSKHIELKDSQLSYVRAAIDCMYSREFEISLDSIQGLIDVASLLQIDSLMEKCSDWMKCQFSLINVMLLNEIACTYSMDDVIDSLASQLAVIFDTAVHNCVLMFQMKQDFLKRVISKDCLQIRSERYLLSQMEKWLRMPQSEHQQLTYCQRESHANHHDYRYDVLKHIRFCLMSHSELMLLQQSDYPNGIQELIKSAIEYHAAFTGLRPVKSTVQNRIRCMTPSLVIALQSGNGAHVQEIIACTTPNKQSTLTNTFSLHISAALHKVCGVATLDNMLYMVSFENYGGFDYDSVVRLSCYDPCIGQQRPLPSPNTQYVPPDIAVLGRRIYLCGGISRSNTVFVPDCEAFDVDTFQWSSIASLPQGRNLSACAGLKDKVYVSGGLVMASNREVSGQLLALNPEKDREWTELASMNVARRGHSMLAHEDKYLIVCGGLMMSNRGPNRRDGIPLERYDRTTNQWTEITSCGTTLPGSSLGHYVMLPHQSTSLYALGHERQNAQEHEIWHTEISGDDSSTIEPHLHMVLPTRYKLQHAFATYLYLNFHDQALLGKKIQHSGSASQKI